MPAMVCPMHVVGGNVNTTSSSKKTVLDDMRQLQPPIPSYICKAWGVLPPPPPPKVPLTSSLSAVMCLFFCIVENRVRTGDAFVAAMQRARSGATQAVRDTVHVTPRPRSTLFGVEREYYRAQATFALNSTATSVFCDGRIPPLSIRDYIARFFTNCPVTEISYAVYLLALIYLDRAMARCPGLFLHSYNAHRMVLGAFVVAAKYHEDEYVFQSTFAKHGGVSVKDLNAIEATFLKAIDYRCFIHKEKFSELVLDLMMEALESPAAPHVLNTLNKERIDGTECALQRNEAKGVNGMPPKLDMLPIRKGDMFNGIELQNEEEAEFFNQFVHSTRLQQWQRRRERENHLLAAAHARALISCMFPDMPVNETPRAVDQWWGSYYTVTHYSHAEICVYRSLLAVICGTAELEATENVQLQARALSSGASEIIWMNGTMVTRTQQPVNVADHSTAIAKSSVSFILNDLDPFADLKNQPHVPAAAAATTSRGGHSLLVM